MRFNELVTAGRFPLMPNRVPSDAQSAPAHSAAQFLALCAGNTYTTTLHTINSAVVKLGKLTKATKVYRGVAGGLLPGQVDWHMCCNLMSSDGQ